MDAGFAFPSRGFVRLCREQAHSCQESLLTPRCRRPSARPRLSRSSQLPPWRFRLAARAARGPDSVRAPPHLEGPPRCVLPSPSEMPLLPAILPEPFYAGPSFGWREVLEWPLDVGPGCAESGGDQPVRRGRRLWVGTLEQHDDLPFLMITCVCETPGVSSEL